MIDVGVGTIIPWISDALSLVVNFLGFWWIQINKQIKIINNDEFFEFKEVLVI